MRSRNRRATKVEPTPAKGRGRGKTMPGLLDYARELAPGKRKAKAEPEPAPEPKRRGRPAKAEAPPPEPEPKRRGRPRKEVVVEAPPEPKRRGRPAKVEVVEEPKPRRGAGKPSLVEAVPKRQGRAPEPVEEPKPAPRRGRAKAAPEVVEPEPEVVEEPEVDEEPRRVQRAQRNLPPSKHLIVFERPRPNQGHDPVDIQPGDLIDYWDKDGGRYIQEAVCLLGKAVELAPLTARIGTKEFTVYPKDHVSVGNVAQVLRLRKGQTQSNVLPDRKVPHE